jgi:Fe-S-cluster containining protein
MQIKTTQLSLQDRLPLTCSRIGTCCHGNQVLLNPWELFRIAKEKNVTPKEFRDLYCDLGGIRLEFNAKKDARGKAACSQYVDGFGCSVHLGRPLACRLFPLGRQIQNNEVHYIHQGDTFPCLDGCNEVLNLPHLSVGEYLDGQITDTHEKAQDEYLELMQNLADIAFELLLDSDLAKSGDTKTLQLWREMGKERPELLVKRIGSEWIDYLTIPEIGDDNSASFTQKHGDLLQSKIQEKFGTLQTNQEFHQASVLIMGITIHLARSIGANPEGLTEYWVDTAKQYGAME